MRRNLGKKHYLLGLLVLLLSPLVVLAALAAYVLITNAVPQKGQLHTAVEPQVVLPWGEAAYAVTYTGEKPAAAPAPEPPLDIVFLIDVSGSMLSSLPDMARAANEVTKELSAAKPGLVRFALISFDTKAEITTDWTAEPEQLYAGLKRLRPFTEQNDTRAAFRVLDEVLGNARPGAKRAAVFYTDGVLEACPPCLIAGFGAPGCCPNGAMPEAEIAAAGRKLRAGGLEIYSIGLPRGEPSALMIEVCGDPNRVFSPSDTSELVANFRSVVEGLTGAPSGGAQLSHRLDSRHFSAPLEGTAWMVDGGGALNLGVGTLPDTPVTYRHPLVPHSAGVWRVGVEPPGLTFTDDRGQLQTLTAERRPLLLAVGWLPLLWGLLPAFLWTLYYLSRRPLPVIERPTILPSVSRPPPPTLLPALPDVREEREAPVPTLYVGLGGAGRRALYAARAELKQAHLSREGQPYRFLWLDLDADEAGRETFFDDWADYPVEGLTAPPQVHNTDRYMPEIGRSPEHLKWFEGQRYHNVPREDLNLSKGAKGDRLLARLALFQWIQEAGEPVSALTEKCRELSSFDSGDGTRQVIVFACPDGGVGGGWFLDIGRLLRRITRAQQRRGEAEFTPEVIGVLCDAPEVSRPENRNAAEMEVESSALSGAFPQHLAYDAAGAGLLDATDTESPFNWLFSASGAGAQDVAAQCGELGAVLAERRPRAALLDEADALGERKIIAVRSRAVHVLPTRLYEQVRGELFLRLVGPDILLDVEPATRGGFAPKLIAEDAAALHLAEWSNGERPGTPLQQLLAAANDPALTPGFLNAMQSSAAPGADWFADALSVSLTHRLQGHGDADSLEWRRDWMPGDAVATLRLLAQRLGQSVGPRLQTAGAAPRAAEAVEAAERAAASAADGLERWVEEFCEVCEEVSRRRDEQTRIGEELRRLGGRTYIDPPTDRARVERVTKEVFEAWLGTPDTTSAIRERFFFAASPDGGGGISIVLRSYIGTQKEFRTARDAGTAIDRDMRALARSVPSVRIGGALAVETVQQRERLARGLVDVTTAPRKVLVVMPRPVDRQGGEPQALEEFRSLIPQPANHGERREQAGDDHAAVRRFELAEVVTEDANHHEGVPFVAAAEQLAERVRKRAEKKHGLFVPPFPPELRIALAHPDSFRSFVRAYKAGRIVRQEDAAGAAQWVFSDTGEFLTFGGDSSLAKAAANYVWYIKSTPQSFLPAGGGGDFSRLKNWLHKRTRPDQETLVQIAVDVYED